MEAADQPEAVRQLVGLAQRRAAAGDRDGAREALGHAVEAGFEPPADDAWLDDPSLLDAAPPEDTADADTAPPENTAATDAAATEPDEDEAHRAELRDRLERAWYAGELGIERRWSDELADLPAAAHAQPRRGRAPSHAGVALVWFPPGELEAALERWPELADSWDGEGYETYARALQGHLLEFSANGLHPSIAPVEVDAYVAWAENRGEDPAQRASRAAYAAEVARRGHAVSWPPGRNDPCWCGSGRKYKRCCGTVDRPRRGV